MSGEAGIGKTALLEHAVDLASELTVVRAVGVESEMGLAFAALHQLCAPLLDQLGRLPAPQRDALAVTFALREGPAPNRFLVALGTLSLLSAAADERPLLCVVDDAQWLDLASAQALAFVARRLVAGSVVLLFAARTPSDQLADLPELVLEGLQPDDARSLLASVIPGRLDERVADEILVETRGNPLALLELPRGLSTAQLAGGFGLPGALSGQATIEQHFLDRMDALPEECRRLLVVAAADPIGDPALLLRVAERLGVAVTALEPAESAGLIEVGERVRFCHPMVRAAVYQAATQRERRKAHRALAEATDELVDPDRRAWHLAEASVGPDDGVADELERAAGRAEARGGLAAAASFLERAFALTADRSACAERALTAAQAKYEAGALADADALLGTAEGLALGDLQRARANLLHAQIAFASRRGGDAPALLLEAARELETVDPDRARTTYLEALDAARFAGQLARGAGVVEVSRAALAGPAPRRPPWPTDLLLQGMATLTTEGRAAAAPILKAALSAFRDEAALPSEESRWLPLAFRAAADLWDEESWRGLATRELERARDDGAVTAKPMLLSTLGFLHAMCGELSTAEALLGELQTTTASTGILAPRDVEVWIAALRGRESELVALVGDFTTDARTRGEGAALAVAGEAVAVLYNGLGRYGEALAAVHEAVDVAPYSELGSNRSLGELVEAAARAGERGIAERALQRLTLSTRPAGTDWALGVEARSRALLREGDVAEALYQEAIERLRRTRVHVHLARAHLVYGEWLRRERRRLDAREQLRRAREMFTTMGIEAFAGRAERELLATGEHVSKRTAGTPHELTPQEVRIARLAGDGQSNAEIGARLFISQHTVAYHLRKVFTKLEITSRNQLTHAPLPEPVAVQAS